MKAQLIALAAGMLGFCIAGIGGAHMPEVHNQAKTIKWDPNTLTLIAQQGGYGRLIRLTGGDILCAFGRRGSIWASRSIDDGKTWSASKMVVIYEFGSAANPELLQLANGWILLSYNERPRDGKHHFTIRTCISRDGGETWTTDSLVYESDTVWKNGCWEPAQIQLPSGEIQLYFANENPYRDSNEQEISMVRSDDSGLTWGKPATVCFRADHRDGMPVPLILSNGKDIVVAIEDNALGRKFRPAIISGSIEDNWRKPYIDSSDPRRWWALASPLPANVNAAAPYIRQFPTGETVLSCQIHEAGAEPVMAVYVGDDEAKNFDAKTIPFKVDPGRSGKWNSLFIKKATTVTAVSGTTIDGITGLWAVDGQLIRTDHEGERLTR
ncbi:MAG: exo-alpha-sialidase [Phycisphaerae bacterium]|nr:exo-alpha-sialidase [Phycisphaerae bacterium]